MLSSTDPFPSVKPRHNARYAGLLERNATTIDSALGGIWLQLATTVGVKAGVKQDLGFFQHCSPVTFGGVPLAHHAQLYSGGYGRGFTECVLQLTFTIALHSQTVPLSCALWNHLDCWMIFFVFLFSSTSAT